MNHLQVKDEIKEELLRELTIEGALKVCGVQLIIAYIASRLEAALKGDPDSLDRDSLQAWLRLLRPSAKQHRRELYLTVQAEGNDRRELLSALDEARARLVEGEKCGDEKAYSFELGHTDTLASNLNFERILEQTEGASLAGPDGKRENP